MASNHTEGYVWDDHLSCRCCGCLFRDHFIGVVLIYILLVDWNKILYVCIIVFNFNILFKTSLSKSFHEIDVFIQVFYQSLSPIQRSVIPSGVFREGTLGHAPS